MSVFQLKWYKGIGDNGKHENRFKFSTAYPKTHFVYERSTENQREIKFKAVQQI